MPRLSPVVFALSVIAAVVATPTEAAQRAFVASTGSDANTASGCLLAAPCRTFTAAHTAVTSGGEIIALDAAGYGPVTVTKSVTLTANPGFFAGIAASTGSAITIATAGISVIVRGLNINGVGATNGINMSNGAKLSVENCVISNFTSRGILVTTTATVRIVDSLIRDNNSGVWLTGGATASITGTKVMGNGYAIYVHAEPDGTTTTAAISDSVVTGNTVGVYSFGYVSGANARVSVTQSNVSQNSHGILSDAGSGGSSIVTASNNLVTGNIFYGLYQGGTAVFETLGNNTSRQNAFNIFGTMTAVGGS